MKKLPYDDVIFFWYFLKYFFSKLFFFKFQIAPEDDKHHLHYGGICCYSCRAFFRRAHQSTKRPNFECKSGGNCQITVKNRRKCQKCRYEKCLNIGMDPRWVLTSDQKKVRFRNYLKKKVVVEHHDSSTHNNPITENHHNIYHHPSATTSSELKLNSAIVSRFSKVARYS